jgi:hypothetical protein
MSPASYLTAPPRVAAVSIARNLVASIAAMALLLWVSVALVVVATVCGLAFLALRGLQLWRTFKAFRRALKETTAALTGSLERLAAAGERAAAAPERLEPSLARLRVSLAHAAILRSAVQDVQDSLGRLTAVYPRK